MKTSLAIFVLITIASNFLFYNQAHIKLNNILSLYKSKTSQAATTVLSTTPSTSVSAPVLNQAAPATTPVITSQTTITAQTLLPTLASLTTSVDPTNIIPELKTKIVFNQTPFNTYSQNHTPLELLHTNPQQMYFHNYTFPSLASNYNSINNGSIKSKIVTNFPINKTPLIKEELNHCFELNTDLTRIKITAEFPLIGVNSEKNSFIISLLLDDKEIGSSVVVKDYIEDTKIGKNKYLFESVIVKGTVFNIIKGLHCINFAFKVDTGSSKNDSKGLFLEGDFLGDIFSDKESLTVFEDKYHNSIRVHMIGEVYKFFDYNNVDVKKTEENSSSTVNTTSALQSNANTITTTTTPTTTSALTIITPASSTSTSTVNATNNTSSALSTTATQTSI